jgi:hypothetical protein
MIYKKIKKFLEEVDITKRNSNREPINPGIPGEFFNSLDAPEYTKTSEFNRGINLCYEGVTDIKVFHEKLEKLAEDVIKDYYSDLVKVRNIKFDIKLTNNGQEIYDFYKNHKSVSESDFDFLNKSENLKQKFITEDKITELEIHKRKIINNIIQGEGLNTKTLINLDKTREGLIEIYSEYDTDKKRIKNRVKNLIGAWNELAKNMSIKDWNNNPKQKGKEIKGDVGGLAGVSAVEIIKDKEEENINIDDIDFDNLDDIDIDDIDESLIFESNIPQIIIKAIGIDFPMLLHETIKAIYSLEYSNSLKDEELSKKLAVATGSIEDEVQDWKYGPIIASALRDFINEYEYDDITPNIRLYTYTDLCKLEVNEFLRTFKGILYKFSKDKGTIISEEAENEIKFSRKQIDKIIFNVIKTLKKYEDDLQRVKEENERAKREWDEYQRELKKWEEYQKNPKSQKIEIEEDNKEDRNKWSKEDYNNAINIALENDDIPRLTLLSNEMKSKKMYEHFHTNYKKFKISK